MLHWHCDDDGLFVFCAAFEIFSDRNYFLEQPSRQWFYVKFPTASNLKRNSSRDLFENWSKPIWIQVSRSSRLSPNWLLLMTRGFFASSLGCNKFWSISPLFGVWLLECFGAIQPYIMCVYVRCSISEPLECGSVAMRQFIGDKWQVTSKKLKTLPSALVFKSLNCKQLSGLKLALTWFRDFLLHICSNGTHQAW